MKLLILFLLWMPVSLFATGGLPDAPYIYVEGDAKITRDPDVVTLSFKLGVRDADQAAAAKQMQTQVTKVLALLDGEKIAEKDVRAEDLHSEPEYNDEQEEVRRTFPRKVLGYHITRPFSVVVREIGKFPKLIDQLLALGVEEFTSISPGLSDEKELAKQARVQALADARSQAEETLKSEKGTILAVYAISPVSIPQISSRMFAANGPEAAVYPAFVAAPRKLDPTQYRLAPIDVTQSVYIIYLISTP